MDYQSDWLRRVDPMFCCHEFYPNHGLDDLLGCAEADRVEIPASSPEAVRFARRLSPGATWVGELTPSSP